MSKAQEIIDRIRASKGFQQRSSNQFYVPSQFSYDDVTKALTSFGLVLIESDMIREDFAEWLVKDRYRGENKSRAVVEYHYTKYADGIDPNSIVVFTGSDEIMTFLKMRF